MCRLSYAASPMTNSPRSPPSPPIFGVSSRPSTTPKWCLAPRTQIIESGWPRLRWRSSLSTSALPLTSEPALPVSTRSDASTTQRLRNCAATGVFDVSPMRSGCGHQQRSVNGRLTPIVVPVIGRLRVRRRQLLAARADIERRRRRRRRRRGSLPRRSIRPLPGGCHSTLMFVPPPPWKNRTSQEYESPRTTETSPSRSRAPW